MGIFDRGESNDELLVVTKLTEDAEGQSVSKVNLTDRKIGGEPALSYLRDGEQPHYILHNRTKGLIYNERGQKGTVQPSDSSWMLGIFTNQRILLLVGSDSGAEQWNIEYDDIESVEASTGILKSQLSLRTLYANYQLYVSGSVSNDEFEDSIRFIRRESDLETSDKVNIIEDTTAQKTSNSTQPADLDEQQILQQLRGMDPYEFEHFIADLWAAQGWKTSVSQSSVDQGVDIIATKENPFPQKQVIQVKRYAENNTIGSPKIQQYSSLRQQEQGADVAVVVTTSGFSRQAEKLAQSLNVKLVDAGGIYQLLNETDRFDLVSSYAPIPIESMTETSGNEESQTIEGEVRSEASAANTGTSSVDNSEAEDGSLLKKFKECPHCGNFVGMKRIWPKDTIFPKLQCTQCQTVYRDVSGGLNPLSEYRTKAQENASNYGYYGVLSGVVLGVFGTVVPALMLVAWILLTIATSRDARYVRANSERNPATGYWVWGTALLPIIGIGALGAIGGGLSLLVVSGAYLIQRYRKDTTDSDIHQEKVRSLIAKKRS